MFLAGQIASEADHPSADWLVFDREYNTRRSTTSALEPDNANCWYDTATQSLHLVVPTQSPLEVAENAAAMVAKCRFPVKKLFVHPCYAVGYGSRITSTCRSTASSARCTRTAARCVRERPLRAVQTSLKRHAFKMHYRIAVDRNTGLLQSFRGDFEGRTAAGARTSRRRWRWWGRRAIDLLLPEEQPGRGRDRVARDRCRLGTWLRHAAEHGGDRDGGRRDHRAAEHRPDRFPPAQRAALGDEEHAGAIPAGALRVDRCSALEAASAVDAPRRAQGRIRGRASGQALRRRLRVRAEGFRHGRGKRAAHGGRDRHRDVDVAGRRGREMAGPSGNGRARGRDRMAGPAGRDQRRSVPHVAGRWGSSERESALVAELCVAVERDELRVLLHAAREAARAVFRYGLWPAAMSIWTRGPRRR